MNTDVWASMGQEDEQKKRERDFAGYTVNQAMMARAAKDAIFLHCLPAHRGEEVSADVIDGPQSRVWDEAENRLHIQKAIMASALTASSHTGSSRQSMGFHISCSWTRATGSPTNSASGREESMYGLKFMGLERTTVIIGRDGKVAKIFRKVKIPGHVQAVEESVRALG